MVTVPRYDSLQVAPQAVPAVRSTPAATEESFGGGAGIRELSGEIRKTTQTAVDIIQEEKRKADEIAVRDADISSVELSNQIEAGVLELKGKNAGSAPDYVNKTWDEGSGKIKENLKNDAQRISAERILRLRRLQLDKSTQVYMVSEFKKYDAEQFSNAIDIYRNQASIKYARPGAVDLSLFQQESEIDRYADRNSMPPEWRQNAKDKAKSATYRDVLERMEIDGNHALAKKYEKGISKFILPDDAAILEKVRKEDKIRRAEADSEFERKSYLLLQDSAATDPQKINAIDNLLRSGKIKLSMAEKMKGWVLDVFDDPEISVEKKVSKYSDLVTQFTDLAGVEVDDDGKPISPAEGNDFETISKFRQEVAKSKRYLTSQQYKKLIELTEADYDASRAPKKNMFDSFKSSLPLLPMLPPGAQINLLQRGMEIFNRGVTPQQAAKTIQGLKDEAVVTGNPLRTEYRVGSVLSAGSEITLNGKKFVIPMTMTVTGYDTDGTPILDEGIVRVKPDGD